MRTNVERVSLWMTGMGLFIMLGLPSVEQGYAAEPTCTLHTLKGRYLFALTGTLFLQHSGDRADRIECCRISYLQWSMHGDRHRDIHPRRRNGVVNSVTPITYSVNEDCTGSYTVPNGPSSVSSSRQMASPSPPSRRHHRATRCLAFLGECHASRRSSRQRSLSHAANPRQGGILLGGRRRANVDCTYARHDTQAAAVPAAPAGAACGAGGVMAWERGRGAGARGRGGR